jgi:type II secretory pathway component PulF
MEKISSFTQRKTLFESMKSKKGQLGGLYSSVLIIASLGILIAILLYVLNQIGTNFTAGSAERNAINTLITQIVNFLPWLGIILLVLGASVVLFYVVRSFSGGARGP